MRLTIGRRIGGLVLVLLLLVGTGAYVSYRSLLEVALAMQERTVSFRTIGELDGIAGALAGAESAERGFVLTGQEPWLAPYAAAEGTVDEALDDLRAAVATDAAQAARLARLEPLVRLRLAALRQTIQLRRESGFEPALQAVLDEEQRSSEEDLRDLLAEMLAHENALLELRSTQAEGRVLAARRLLVLGSALALLLATVASWLITRSVIGPLQALKEGAARLGAGDLDSRIDVGRDDELADLGHAFNHMGERLKAVEGRVNQEVAEREKVLSTIQGAVQELGNASQELLAGATQQAAGMQEQAAAVAETVTVVDEVSHTATQAAERAKLVATSARRSEEVGVTGKKAVDHTVEVINLARAQADAVAGKIASLAEHTQAIGDIVTLLNEIAEQTNLLALNAAIEAARAGEHGRGFSVVAAEVKALADESRQATRRVRQILGDIQKMANNAVLSTEEGARSMTTATHQAETAGQAIQELTDVITDVVEAATQIAASAGQQATGLGQVHQAMRDIKQVSTQNLAATQQAQKAATNLAALGASLKTLLSTSTRSLAPGTQGTDG